MISNGETVCLIPDPLEPVQSRVSVVEDHRVTPPWQIYLLLALRERSDGQVRRSRSLHRLECRTKLAAAAVDQDQVRQGLPLADPPLKVASNDFLHHGVVIRQPLRCRPDTEPPVFVAVSPAVTQPDGTAY
jgi:hypothetical protein